MNWAAHKVLVTGGTRGIGRELVLQLQALGAQVVATGQSAASVATAAAALPGVDWRVCDLADATSRAALAQGLQGAGLTMLVHNAGVQQLRDFTADGAAAAEPIALQAEADINLVAPIELTRALLPALRVQPQGVVVFVTSGLALAPKRSSPLYCATKAGLRFFAKALRAQVRAAGWPLRVVEALPPIVDTDMTRGRGGARKMPAAEAARQILSGIAAGRDEVLVGASRLLKLLLRLSPALGERIMINR
jgi:uncharacterized oxidoreductase